MGSKTLSGPGKIGSMSKMKKSLKGGANEFVRNIPAESSLTVRFLDEPEDFVGYYEHWVGGQPIPCTSDECEGCASDDPEESKKMFRYLANAYVVDDQKVRAVKMPKTLVQQLVDYHTKFDGTLRDRDYDLSKSGSGKQGTRYMASPDSPNPMKLKGFDSQKFDLEEILLTMVNDDAEPPSKGGKKSKDKPAKDKPKKKKEKNPWDDVDEDAPKKKKSASSKPGVKKKTTKSAPARRVVKRK